jgi:hypothetical protein
MPKLSPLLWGAGGQHSFLLVTLSDLLYVEVGLVRVTSSTPSLHPSDLCFGVMADGFSIALVWPEWLDFLPWSYFIFPAT